MPFLGRQPNGRACTRRSGSIWLDDGAQYSFCLNCRQHCKYSVARPGCPHVSMHFCCMHSMLNLAVQRERDEDDNNRCNRERNQLLCKSVLFGPFMQGYGLSLGGAAIVTFFGATSYSEPDTDGGIR